MPILKYFLVCTFGLLVHVVDRTDCRNADPNLRNTLSESEQNIGETCFANIPMTCDQSFKYREINAGCTNLDFPTRGMAGSVFTRLLPALYSNKEDFRVQKDGKELNSARVLSNIFFTEQKEGVGANFDTEFSLSMMIWSQVVTHDMSGTSGKSGPSCCTANSQRLKTTTANCEGVKIPTNDRFYSSFHKTCISVPRSKNTDDLNCNVGQILPLNFVTAFLDASLLYGSTVEANKQIRAFQNGAMKCQTIDGSIFPPNVNDPKSVCRVSKNEDLCIQAGDVRSNAHPMLTVLQTILLRLHNKIAQEFARLNPNMNDEILFQETRRLVIAMIQHITFKYFVPNLLGQSYLEKIQCGLVKDSDYNNIYDKTINPQMMTEFSGCVFRSLHSTIVDKVMMYDENRKPVSQWKFSDFYNAVSFITVGSNFEQLVIGMATDAEGNLDRHFPISITDLLFQVDGVGADMESIDVTKCRDMGVNTYAKYLEMIGKPYPTSWEDYAAYMPQNMIDRLKTRYDSYEDVELFIGGILENDTPDSRLGPVFQAIIAEQFCRTQKGDRFYYELGDQAYPFTPQQLEQIRKVTLSLVYCYTCDKLQNMQPDAFRQISPNNQVKSCKDIIGDFTLDPWKQ